MAVQRMARGVRNGFSSCGRASTMSFSLIGGKRGDRLVTAVPVQGRRFEHGRQSCIQPLEDTSEMRIKKMMLVVLAGTAALAAGCRKNAVDTVAFKSALNNYLSSK